MSESERTYMGSTLEDIEMGSQMDGVTLGLVAHIRELQAEVAKRKIDWKMACVEIIRLKAERREFGLRVATAMNNEWVCERWRPNLTPEQIVEQELAK